MYFFFILYKPSDNTSVAFVEINDRTIIVEVADDHQERVQGLSDREGLEGGHGMLFVFDEEDYHGIWMKNMKFNIDVIWFDEKGNIVHIEEDLGPETFPTVFKPDHPALYILEISTDEIESYKLIQRVSFQFSR